MITLSQHVLDDEVCLIETPLTFAILALQVMVPLMLRQPDVFSNLTKIIPACQDRILIKLKGGLFQISVVPV